MNSWLVLICLGVGDWPKMTHINHRSQNSELSQKVLGSAGVRSHWTRARISAWPPKVVCKLWRYNLCLCVGVGDGRQLGRKTFAKLDDLAHALCRLNISWTLLLQQTEMLKITEMYSTPPCLLYSICPLPGIPTLFHTPPPGSLLLSIAV